MIRIALGRGSAPGIDREWLETDGRGGYASSTLTDLHTRRYHGLMVANLQAPEGRYVLLSKLEDSLMVGGEEYFFTRHRYYPAVLSPPGPPLLQTFDLDVFPRFAYRMGKIRLRKSVLLVRDKDLLLIRYDLDGSSEEALLRLKPFLAFRGYHELALENRYLCSGAERIENGFRIEPYGGMPPLSIQTSSASSFRPLSLWYNRFEYTEEKVRGFDFQEDLFLPGVIELPLGRGGTAFLCAACGPPSGEDPAAIWEAETTRRRDTQTQDKGLADGLNGEERGILHALIRAGRQFLITTPSGRPAIIAGYPWFGSWGRDTLISLPGLAFCCGRIREGIEILSEIGKHAREGLLPNFFSADGRPEAYNTIDSSLLYFWTVQELLRITGDGALIRSRFWPVMKEIIRRFTTGTRFGIGIDAHGLLQSDDERVALTWMDATVSGIPITPRNGCAVEINALWYNALCFTRDLAERFGEPASDLEVRISLVRRSFREIFWNPEEGCLGDVFRNGILDTAIRPNQIFAVSLPFSPLDLMEQTSVVRTVREQLLTPCGLRTLSPADPAYRGLYRGDASRRDAAYHQGTVWPWLLGPFGEAVLRVAEDREQEKQSLRTYLLTFLRTHLHEAGIGSVSEVFDGDPPHRPGGCIAQAWSVAELIRLYLLLRDA